MTVFHQYIFINKFDFVHKNCSYREIPDLYDNFERNVHFFLINNCILFGGPSLSKQHLPSINFNSIPFTTILYYVTFHSFMQGCYNRFKHIQTIHK